MCSLLHGPEVTEQDVFGTEYMNICLAQRPFSVFEKTHLFIMERIIVQYLLLVYICSEVQRTHCHALPICYYLANLFDKTHLG